MFTRSSTINSSIPVENTKNVSKKSVQDVLQNAIDAYAVTKLTKDCEDIIASIQKLVNNLQDDNTNFEELKTSKECLKVGYNDYYINMMLGDTEYSLIPPDDRMTIKQFKMHLSDVCTARQDLEKNTKEEVSTDDSGEKLLSNAFDEYFQEKEIKNDTQKNSIKKKVEDNTIIHMDVKYAAGKAFIFKVRGECKINLLKKFTENPAQTLQDNKTDTADKFFAKIDFTSNPPDKITLTVPDEIFDEDAETQKSQEEITNSAMKESEIDSNLSNTKTVDEFKKIEDTSKLVDMQKTLIENSAMDTISEQVTSAEKKFNQMLATEIPKANVALQNLQKQAAKNPEILKEMLADLDIKNGIDSEQRQSKYAAWSNKDVQEYLQSVNPNLLRSVVISKGPLPKQEYEQEIANEIVRTLKKGTFIHKKNPKIAKEFHFYLGLINKANKMRVEGKPSDDIDKQVKKLWLQMRYIDPDNEKVFSFLGKGACGSTDFVTHGESGFISVKKTIYNPQHLVNVELQAYLDHKSVVKVIPVDLKEEEKGLIGYMEPSGVSLLKLFKRIFSSDLAEKMNDINDVINTIKEEVQAYSFDYIEELFKDIKETYTHFNRKNIHEIIFLIDDFLKTIEDPQQIESLEKWKGLCEIWKGETPWKPNDDKSLSLESLRRIFYSACVGLAYIHDMDVAHGDLDLGNMLIGHNGEIQYIDFDLGKHFPKPRSKSQEMSFQTMKHKDLQYSKENFYLLTTGEFNCKSKEKQLGLLTKQFPYLHERKMVIQLGEVLDKMDAVEAGKASLNDVLKLTFFSQL